MRKACDGGEIIIDVLLGNNCKYWNIFNWDLYQKPASCAGPYIGGGIRIRNQSSRFELDQ